MDEIESIWRTFLTPPATREMQREADLAQSARQMTVAHEEMQIQAYSWGSGPRVMLVHGWGSRATHYFALIPMLVEMGFEVVAFDAPAHGRSTGDICSAPAISRALVAVVNSSGPVDAIVGHSLGGLSASMAIFRGMLVRRAVFLAPCCDIAPSVIDFASRSGMSAEGQAEFVRIFRTEFDGQLGSIGDLLAGKSLPMLLLHDPDDPDTPFHLTESLGKSRPDAVLQPLAGAGHRGIMRHKSMLAAVGDFLRPLRDESNPPHAFGEEKGG
ncbi:alpha/beta fold hydrolase [Tuwongella immobilis]|uniref:AB hydrolase-1 domain-containing protein n=1 Tax=Tuwongella immobilis TaxID=692036 RepID=A0A6C2YN42_9BACT|nr:alpha/beta hydrolase [Tuwongella immobilis]VIP02804.1 Putative hydrolase or acyltransferase of alpha/beta superfamily OS=Rivularia sp. PCC 7116 GN=Riv7116_2250 PE=4 SV=1: Abhydrolase_6 [Tuwongella immobilis]VTS02500.1 Putative hydrolase or acyltransferase of alpha/beta superfamily OS=Rivularia sp. PCC 7116 GN=Riv7116_2250 PE=4 SV=1: Abhydrolase_6 [Tuwongella immobilis]